MHAKTQIIADPGRFYSYRSRVYKEKLQKFATKENIEIGI
jgi:hypothetical protein